MESGVAKIWVVKNKKRPEFYSRTSLCGFGRSGFAIFMLFLLIFAGVSVSAGTTKKGNGAGFEISVVKDYPGKVITLEVNGPPETEFQIILKDSDNRLISPKENVSFVTDEKGKYILQLVGFVPGTYSVTIVYNETEYVKKFEVGPSAADFVCNRTFLEYRTESSANVTETNVSPVTGRYVWDICRDFVEVDVRKVLTGPEKEANKSSARVFVERVVKFLAERKNFMAEEDLKFRLVSKRVFSEGSTVVEEFPRPEPRKILLYGPGRRPVLVEAEMVKIDRGEHELRIRRPREFRPGLYRIAAEFAEGDEIYSVEEEFLWGVLAVNTHKSVYLPGEQAFIGMAVLDNNGHMVCDADVTLEIIDPLGKITTLTTSDGTIKVSDECEVYGVTNLPDYYAYYRVGGEGTYTMKLTAKTRDGERSITDAFEVRKHVDFDVERDGPTRIYPPAKYQMSFKIKANKDYEGGNKRICPLLL